MRTRRWFTALLVVTAVKLALVTVLYRAFLRHWMYTWGATADEIDATLPGDELVQPRTPRTTRALSIEAPVEVVWQWLVQIGEERAGFYSYSALERMAGARMHNANAIHPEWQQREVGDTVWLAHRYGEVARQLVTLVKPGSHLVLMSRPDHERVQRGEPATGSWGFFLVPEDGHTRLVVRGCGGAVGHPAFDVPHFVMEQKMMRGLRDRAEGVVSRSRSASPGPTSASRRSCAPSPVAAGRSAGSRRRPRGSPPTRT
ncbi:MAG: hypothetical protein ACHQIG_13860 [Acidimicrobiia bacterium]